MIVMVRRDGLEVCRQLSRRFTLPNLKSALKLCKDCRDLLNSVSTFRYCPRYRIGCPKLMRVDAIIWILYRRKIVKTSPKVSRYIANYTQSLLLNMSRISSAPSAAATSNAV